MLKENLQKSIDECEAMLRYARANGKPVKPELQSTLEKLKIFASASSRDADPTVQKFTKPAPGTTESPEDMVKELAKAHQDLSGAVYPALPQAIMVLEEGGKSVLRFLGPIPLIRYLMIISIFCLFSFLALFVTPYVDSKSVSTDILGMDNWLEFCFNEAVIVMAAALGACFYALFEAYKYVANGSYDPRFESIYWIRFTLGIVSGVILAQFIFQPSMDIEHLRLLEAQAQIEIEKAIKAGQDIKDLVGGNNGAGAPNMQGLFTYSPLISFLGGFSARVVHKILNSLVDSVESFISGSARDLLRAREESAKVQLEDKLNTMKQQAAAKDAANKTMSAIQLMQLQQQLNAGMPLEQVNAKLDEMKTALINPIGGQGMFETPPVVTQPAANTNIGLDEGGGEFTELEISEPVKTHTETANEVNDILSGIPTDDTIKTTTVNTPPVNNNPPVNNTPPAKEEAPHTEFNPFGNVTPPTTNVTPPTTSDNPFGDVHSNDNPFGDVPPTDNPFGDVPPNKQV